MNLLFICSRNQWRSPTAETIFRNRNGIFTKSAGTESSARTRVNGKHLTWADLIFVMEKKHKRRLTENFANHLSDREIIVLDIPDEYQYMDEELIEILNTLVEPYIN